ncbi:hypothetical protein TNCV_4059351 [Trichonephila clavipes]|nr:hypothetical protein TNCV_4059351 [Trichonephila clavipes]
MVLYVRKKGSLPYISSRSVMSEGIPYGPKRSDANVPHVFPKAVSQVGDTLHAKVGSRLDAFRNRPTTSTRSRTRPPVACNA